MQLDSVILFGKELAVIDNSLAGTRPTYAKAVTINYTAGKIDDPRWSGARSSALGNTRPWDVRIDEATLSCTASFVVDAWQILSSSATPASTIGRQKIPAQVSPRGFKYMTITTVVHELVHVNQGWQIGQPFAKELLEERISAAARAKDYAKANPDLPDDAYLQNVFEHGARDFTTRWIQAHREDIHSGVFDFLLAKPMMRGLFPDSPM